MARPSVLKKMKQGKYTYWGARIRGERHLFGNVKSTSRAQAQEAFAAALAGKPEPKPVATSSTITNVARLYDDYIGWVRTNLSADSLRCKRSNLKTFCQWKPAGSRQPIKNLAVSAVTVDHLIEYLEHRQEEDDSAPKTLWHYVTDVKAMWNWGAGRNPDHPVASHMPETHDPFRRLKRPTPGQKNLTADSLPTDAEVDQLIRNSKFEGFQPILKALHQTGARPGELCGAKVRDFDPDNRSIILYRHKNDGRRHENATPRVVPLSGNAFKLIQGGCEGKKPDEPIFTGPLGAAWTRDRLGKKFREVRRQLEASVREHITLYWFRHLWISEALRNGCPIATVAAAAGTSAAMIQKTYGHFFVADLVTVANLLETTRSKRKAASRKV